MSQRQAALGLELPIRQVKRLVRQGPARARGNGVKSSTVAATGHGPANVTRLRRFVIGVLKSFQKPNQSIAEMMRQLARRSRQVLD